MSVAIQIIKGSAKQFAKEIRKRNHLTWKQLYRLLPKLPFQIEEEEFQDFCERNRKSRAILKAKIKNG